MHWTLLDIKDMVASIMSYCQAALRPRARKGMDGEMRTDILLYGISKGEAQSKNILIVSLCLRKTKREAVGLLFISTGLKYGLFKKF